MKRLAPGDRGRCPHCGDRVTFDPDGYDNSWSYNSKEGASLEVSVVECSGCHQPVVQLSVWEQVATPPHGARTQRRALVENRLVWPPAPTYPVAEQVPDAIKEDFLEAAAVLPYSAKASAALSRRCLEAVLDSSGEVKGRNLFDKIASLEGKVPAYIYRDLDALRQLGNRGAHLKKKAGQLLAVHETEAQWNLVVLTELFDHYYVKPALSEAMRRRIEDDVPPTDVAALLGFASDEGEDEQGGSEDDGQRTEAGRTPLSVDDEFPPEEDLPF